MKPSVNQIKPDCKRCKLHETAHPKSVCLRGRYTDEPKKLMVFTDHPDFFADRAHSGYKLDAYKLLSWFLARMSLDIQDVALDYILRCYPAKELPSTKAERANCIEECSSFRFKSIARVKPLVIVALGQVSLEAFTGQTKIGDHEGRIHPCWEPVIRDYCQHIWSAHSLAYVNAPGGASAAPGVFRVLFRAAEEAGLKPVINPDVPPYQWRNIL